MYFVVFSDFVFDELVIVVRSNVEVFRSFCDLTVVCNAECGGVVDVDRYCEVWFDDVEVD